MIKYLIPIVRGQINVQMSYLCGEAAIADVAFKGTLLGVAPIVNL